MAEAANEGILSMVNNCHSHRLVSQICTALAADRNAKLRLHCASYLLQVGIQNNMVQIEKSRIVMQAKELGYSPWLVRCVYSYSNRIVCTAAHSMACYLGRPSNDAQTDLLARYEVAQFLCYFQCQKYRLLLAE